MHRILFLVNHDIVIYNFRRELVENLLQRGYEVVISSPYGERIELLKNIGCKYIETDFSRHSKNPIKEVKLVRQYIQVIKDIKPNIVLTYTVKPNIYGGIICRILKVPYIVNITGLGTAVENRGILQKVILALYRIALKDAQKVFFQNSENQLFMVEHRIVNGAYDLLPGSGVNLSSHYYREYPNDRNTINFVFIGRLMRDKGIEELVNAAKIIKEKYRNISFTVIGACEDDYQEQLCKLEPDKYMNMVGYQLEVDTFIGQAHAIVHPTYHEGMSNVLLEAAACGRPILASNIPGCWETFDEGISGIGFEPRNIASLCEAVEKFISLPYEEKVKMGRAGRKKMESEFNRNIIVEKYMKEIQNMLEDNGYVTV